MRYSEQLEVTISRKGEMAGKALRFFWLVIGAILVPAAGWAQAPVGAAGGPGSTPGLGGLRLSAIPMQDWAVFGRVTNLKGDPVGGATVRIDIPGGKSLSKTLETNLQGEFRTTYSLDAQLYQRLSVKVAALKGGFRESREAVDFGTAGLTHGIDIVLRANEDDPDQLPLPTLVRQLGARLRRQAGQHLTNDSTRKDFLRGSEEFLDRHNAVIAVPYLAKVVERESDCIECRMLLTLALLDAGSWAGAGRQLTEAAKLNEAAQPTARRPEPWLVLGILEAWRYETKKAAGFFQKALEVAPGDPLALQELGRTLILQKNWEAADEYLEKAIQAGAAEGARLLRVRALLEQGDSGEAEKEMNQYLAGRDIRFLPFEARALYSQLQTYIDLRPYGKVKSVATQPLPELMKAMPELAGLVPATSQEELVSILQKTGESVELMFRTFPNTVSVEQIRQERRGKDGKVKNSSAQSFQYLLLARPESWGLGLEEYRTNARGDRGAPVGLKDGFMLTAGFASAPLLFHPAYQSGSNLRYLGRQVLDGRDTYVVAFAQRAETAKMIERFNTENASVLVLLQGVAWIDAATYRIIRMRTDLLKPPTGVRLERQTTEIRFQQIPFAEIATALWLPQEVAVTVDWKGKTFRNSHRYSDFKLFNVATEERRKTTVPPSPAPENPN
jgi:tetratricopeptide (TPR) repeat protein